MLPAENVSRELGGAAIWVKLEGLANTGAHKINNALGQGLLARRMGKRRIIAETGAGQHGVATAAVCAKLGLACRIYMGETDIRRQRPNVFWMERFGAEVVPVRGGAGTLKDAVNEALRDWAGSYRDTHYLLGSALGPSPFPDMVREFQSVIGRETQAQLALLRQQMAQPQPGSGDRKAEDPYLSGPVKNAILKAAPSLQQCYLDLLKTKPSVTSGKLHLDWQINKEGKVLEAGVVQNQLENKAFGDCVVQKIAGLHFPPPPFGQTKYVEHSLFFKDEAALKEAERERAQGPLVQLPKK